MSAASSQPCPLSIEWWEASAPKALPEDAGAKALNGLKRLHDGGLPLLKIVENTQDLEEIEQLGKQIIAQSDTLVLVGIGGSSLGGEALTALRNVSHSVEFMVMDNPDPDSFDRATKTLNPERTSWLFVSKSGGTLETVTQVILILDWLEQRIGKAELAKRCYAFTEPKPSALTTLAKHFNLPIYEHNPDLGGRWSCVSNIGLVPAAACGLNVRELRRGMAEMLEHSLSAPVAANEPLQGAIFGVQHAAEGRSIHAIMPYVDRLEYTAAWCRQLISESIGKDGKGITPLAALGTVDQHSMLQLMLDGPDDKYFTVITSEQIGKGVALPKALVSLVGWDYLAEKPLGNVLNAFQQGTIGSLQASRRPVRTIHLPQVDEYHLGALLMYFMLETILIAELLGVNAFDQPAVEDSKIRAKHVLGA